MVFDRPFDRLTVLSKVEGLTTLSQVEGQITMTKIQNPKCEYDLKKEGFTTPDNAQKKELFF
jgi:hypothetical protein